MVVSGLVIQEFESTDGTNMLNSKGSLFAILRIILQNFRTERELKTWGNSPLYYISFPVCCIPQKDDEVPAKSLPRHNTEHDIWASDHLTPSWVCLPNDQPVLAIIQPGESVLDALESICKVILQAGGSYQNCSYITAASQTLFLLSAHMKCALRLSKSAVSKARKFHVALRIRQKL